MNKAYYTKNSSDYWAVSTPRNENLTNNFLWSRAKDRKKKGTKKSLMNMQSCFAKAFWTFLSLSPLAKARVVSLKHF